MVARWETGRTNPDFATVVEAIRAAGFELSCSIDERDDHDLALIRRELTLLPYQRLAGMVEAMRSLSRMEGIASG